MCLNCAKSWTKLPARGNPVLRRESKTRKNERKRILHLKTDRPQPSTPTLKEERQGTQAEAGAYRGGGSFSTPAGHGTVNGSGSNQSSPSRFTRYSDPETEGRVGGSPPGSTGFHRCCVFNKQRSEVLSEWNVPSWLLPANRPWTVVCVCACVSGRTWVVSCESTEGRTVKQQVKRLVPLALLLTKPSTDPTPPPPTKKGLLHPPPRQRAPAAYCRTTIPLRRELRSTYSASSSDDEHESSYEQREPPQSRRTRSPLRVMP